MLIYQRVIILTLHPGMLLRRFQFFCFATNRGTATPQQCFPANVTQAADSTFSHCESSLHQVLAGGWFNVFVFSVPAMFGDILEWFKNDVLCPNIAYISGRRSPIRRIAGLKPANPLSQYIAVMSPWHAGSPSLYPISPLDLHSIPITNTSIYTPLYIIYSIYI